MTSSEAYENRNWAQICRGMRYDYDTGKLYGDLTIGDLAKTMSGITRYNAWTDAGTWSLASHACLVAEIIAAMADYDHATILGGLHHDDHETLVGDQVQPFKTSWSDAMRVEYQAHARRAQTAITTALGISDLLPPAGDSSRHGVIRAADVAALEAERRWLFLPRLTWITEQIVNPRMLEAGERILRGNLSDVRGGAEAAGRFVATHNCILQQLGRA